MADQNSRLVLGEAIDLDQFMSVVRHGAKVEFSPEYEARVTKARKLIEKWVDQGRVMYGVTTGFGSLSTKVISKEEGELLQKNIIECHSVSVGQPMNEEEVRGTLLMILQNLGQGNSGVRLELLEQIRQMLNAGITPWAPREGSVGYLAPEAHMALVIIGEGKAWLGGQLMSGAEALRKAGLKPLPLSYKEGLALVSGTTSVTALGAIALYDLIGAAKAADIIGAFSLETLHGIIRAFDERVMKVRPHATQAETAENVRKILADSEVIRDCVNDRIQDALSLRCIPQLHGAAKKIFRDAKETIEIEMNSCCDNPIIWPNQDDADVISACNPDSSFVGMAMDSCGLAAVSLAKMSERRNDRIIDESLNGGLYPSFLIKAPGLNSGLMIPQYTQAGLLNDMRILAHPATVDNTPTCNDQEDYVAMGYNASKKAEEICEKLEYILAIELLSDYQSCNFDQGRPRRGSVSQAVYKKIGEKVPLTEEDTYLHPYIEELKEFIHSGKLQEAAEAVCGPLK